MYKVLYRKWRPQVFADVVGQPQVTVTLKNELMAGRIAHAYLFTGSRGTGKDATCAKILAKAVNCLASARTATPAASVKFASGIDDGTVLDIVEIDAASNNGVDNIRELRDEVEFRPRQGKIPCVYHRRGAYARPSGAFNALLKDS